MPLVGLDQRYFHPRPAPELRARLGLSGPVIGYVGRLSPEKGVDILLQAAARLTLPAQLLIVGDGPDKAALRSLADTLDFGERCVFADAVNYDQVAYYLNLLDVLVLPSRTTLHWKEQFGRVLMEAMGCRVAVVGSASSAILEVIGEAGQTFPEGDVDSLASALDRLITDPAARQSLAERGYQRALAHYTTERIAAQTSYLWRELLAQSS